MDSPFPEELNRQGIDLISTYYFAPTEDAKAKLMAEGKKEENILVTGNTGIDALFTTVRKNFSDPLIQWAEGSGQIP